MIKVQMGLDMNNAPSETVGTENPFQMDHIYR